MGSYNICPFVSSFSRWRLCFQGLCMSLTCSAFIPSCGWATAPCMCVPHLWGPIHTSMGVWVASTCWLLQCCSERWCTSNCSQTRRGPVSPASAPGTWCLYHHLLPWAPVSFRSACAFVSPASLPLWPELGVRWDRDEDPVPFLWPVPSQVGTDRGDNLWIKGALLSVQDQHQGPRLGILNTVMEPVRGARTSKNTTKLFYCQVALFFESVFSGVLTKLFLTVSACFLMFLSVGRVRAGSCPRHPSVGLWCPFKQSWGPVV